MDAVNRVIDRIKGFFGVPASAPGSVPAPKPPAAPAPLVTVVELAQIYACPVERAAPWVGPIDATLRRYAITTPARIAAFLAQVGHESGRLRHVRELWGPTPAQQRYEGRGDLGNVVPGDGLRYLGRGLIQITGRYNYGLVADGLDIDCLNRPELLEEPMNAALSAGWYWNRHHLNDQADLGRFDEITRRINGGQNGRADRVALHAKALQVLR